MNYVPVMLILAAFSNQSEPTDYKTAYKRAMKGDKPLLVLVTAEWCPPCQRMKQTTIPRLIEDDNFRNVHFATVDLDRNHKDARNLIGNGTVPQLIMFEKNQGKWTTRTLMGYNSPEMVQAFMGSTNSVRTADAGIIQTGK